MSKKFVPKLIITLIFSFFLVCDTVYAQDYQKGSILDVNLHYNLEQVTIVSVDKRIGYLPDYRVQPEKGYTLQIFDKNFQELYKVKFEFPLQVITEGSFDQQKLQGSSQLLSEADSTVTVPVFENARTLKILDPEGQLAFEHNLSVIVDPDLAQRGATKALLFNPWPWIVGFGLLIAIVLSSYFIFARRTPRTVSPRTNGRKRIHTFEG